ncbi:MAG: glucuronyl hydrolase, partial [Bacteroidota bacterium]
EEYKQIIVEASNTLIKRYNEEVGAIRSWDFNKEVWQFPVIIDNMMNLEMLFAATQYTGDSVYYDIAYQHAMTTIDNHFREDHSTYHVIDYDTLSGKVRNRHTHQGAAHESAWARGQAWGLYGYTMAYGITKEPKFLETAKNIAQLFFEHPNMPDDKVPYWDFDAPNIPNEPRDASAAAIAASAMLELLEYDPAQKEQYLEWVDTILQTLGDEDYQSDTTPYILEHSVGSVPGDSEVDVPLTYADYYYVEALLRRLAIEKTT